MKRIRRGLAAVLLVGALPSFTYPGSNAALLNPEVKITSVRVSPMPAIPPDNGTGYGIKKLGGELQGFSGGHHFLTAISSDGIFAIRLHPGVDINGWGVALYLQGFFPGARLENSRTAVIGNTTPDSIRIDASGKVALGASETFGDWEAHLTFNYDRIAKTVRGSGRYLITLAGSMSSSTSDLNVCRVASNYLENVPLMDGTFGNTGDTELVLYSGHNFRPQPWDLMKLPAHCPQDRTFKLGVRTFGAYNQVDTARLSGICPIQTAHKPSLDVTLTSTDQNVPMIFCGFFDRSKNKDPFSENVGVTPVVLRTSTSRKFEFDIDILATTRPEDGRGILVEFNADVSDRQIAELEVFCSESVIKLNEFRRPVGSIFVTQPGKLGGTVQVPFNVAAPGLPPKTQFFLLRGRCP